jgi:hypothetical protein
MGDKRIRLTQRIPEKVVWRVLWALGVLAGFILAAGAGSQWN